MNFLNKVNKYRNNEIGTWKKDPKCLALTAGSHSSAGKENILDVWSHKLLYLIWGSKKNTTELLQMPPKQT